MKMNKNSDSKTIIEKMKTESNAIAKGIEKGTFSKDELLKMNKEIDAVILEAHKTKYSIQMDRLIKEYPNLILNDVIVKMLNLLPEDIEEAHIPILTEFIIEKWKSISQKLAA